MLLISCMHSVRGRQSDGCSRVGTGGSGTGLGDGPVDSCFDAHLRLVDLSLLFFWLGACLARLARRARLALECPALAVAPPVGRWRAGQIRGGQWVVPNTYVAPPPPAHPQARTLRTDYYYGQEPEPEPRARGAAGRSSSSTHLQQQAQPHSQDQPRPCLFSAVPFLISTIPLPGPTSITRLLSLAFAQAPDCRSRVLPAFFFSQCVNQSVTAIGAPGRGRHPRPPSVSAAWSSQPKVKPNLAATDPRLTKQ